MDEQSAGPRGGGNRSLQNKDTRTKQAFQMTDGCPKPGHRPSGSGQQFRAWAGTEDAPHPGLTWPRSSACPAGVGEWLTLHKGELTGCLGVCTKDAPRKYCFIWGSGAASGVGLWEEGRCLPTPRIMALGHWEEVGQKGIKAVFTARRGHKAPAGVSSLSRLPPWAGLRSRGDREGCTEQTE